MSQMIDTQARRSPGRWASALIAVVMFASGVGIGWLFTSEAPDAGEEISAAPTTTVPVADTTTTTRGEAPNPPVVATDPLVEGGSTDDRIAEVAEALLPSVVQIELPLQGVGSGVVLTADGAIMTAAHVVEGQDEVIVRLADGTKVPGQVIGADVENDIAVVTVDRTDLIPAPLAIDRQPRVGERAIALGSPWGLEATVTAGIVSAVNQAIAGADGVPRAMLQTDAAINPGNSGGPLADIQGRVIGINVSIFTRSGQSSGVGFAVPIDRAYRVASALLEGGEFVPGFLGVGVETSESGRPGAAIIEISPGTAAEEVGLELGDLIVSVEDVPITDPLDLAAQIRAYQAGDTVTLVVEREGEQFSLEVELGARPPQQTG